MVQYKPMVRVVTFVPPKALYSVIRSVMRVARLAYGSYEHVLWHSRPGREYFTPTAAAHPTVGKANIVSAEPSVRLEFSVPDSAEDLTTVRRIIEEGIIPAHPWEEPVIHYYRVIETRTQCDEDQ